MLAKIGPALQNDHFDAFPIETIQDPFKASLEQEIPRNVYLISRFEIRRQGLRKQRCESPTLQMPKQQWSKLSFAAQMVRDVTGLQVLEFFYGPLDYGCIVSKMQTHLEETRKMKKFFITNREHA